jgi:hypothetical protein
VSWYSRDGKLHSVAVPTRELIKDWSVFVGFKFFFVDDHLDVYLLTNRAQRVDKYLDVIETKVFSK